MTREQLEHAIRAAGAIAGDPELYVVGSQAILGAFPEAPPDLRRSMEVDIAPKNRPELEALIEGSSATLWAWIHPSERPWHSPCGGWRLDARFTIAPAYPASGRPTVTLTPGWNPRKVEGSDKMRRTP